MQPKWFLNGHLTNTKIICDLSTGFLLPPDQIVPSSLEFIDGLVALAGDLKVQLDAKK